MMQSGLVWPDIVKLCIPFAFSLILLWAKQWFENRVERKSKSEILWRAIDQSSMVLGRVLDELDLIAEAYNNDRIRIVAIVVPQNAELGNRMAELDPKHAYIFSDYTGQTKVVRSGLARLERLTDRAIEAGEGGPGSIKRAITAQVMSSKCDFVSLAHSAVGVLEVLSRSNQNFDRQLISRQESVITELESKIKDKPQASNRPPSTSD